MALLVKGSLGPSQFGRPRDRRVHAAETLLEKWREELCRTSWHRPLR